MLAVIKGVPSRFCKILYIQRKGGVTQRNAAHIILSNFICCYFAVKKIVAFLQYNTLLMANMGYSCFFLQGGRGCCSLTECRSVFSFTRCVKSHQFTKASLFHYFRRHSLQSDGVKVNASITGSRPICRCWASNYLI